MAFVVYDRAQRREERSLHKAHVVRRIGSLLVLNVSATLVFRTTGNAILLVDKNTRTIAIKRCEQSQQTYQVKIGQSQSFISCKSLLDLIQWPNKTSAVATWNNAEEQLEIKVPKNKGK